MSKNYIIVNKISNLVIWRGTEEEVKKLTWFNPFMDVESTMKLYHDTLGNEIFVKI